MRMPRQHAAAAPRASFPLGFSNDASAWACAPQREKAVRSSANGRCPSCPTGIGPRHGRSARSGKPLRGDVRPPSPGKPRSQGLPSLQGAQAAYSSPSSRLGSSIGSLFHPVSPKSNGSFSYLTSNSGESQSCTPWQTVNSGAREGKECQHRMHRRSPRNQGSAVGRCVEEDHQPVQDSAAPSGPPYRPHERHPQHPNGQQTKRMDKHRVSGPIRRLNEDGQSGQVSLDEHAFSIPIFPAF